MEETAVIAMYVPYVSQWDDTAKLSRGDCGIVAACMCALWKGINTSPDQMIQKANLPIGQHSYDFPDVVKAGAAVGLKLQYTYPATWDVIRKELDATRPTITLLRYGVVADNQDDFDGSHFWTVVGYDSDSVYVNDPDWWGDLRALGAMRRIPLDQFQAAIGPALEPTGNKAYQSIFLVPDAPVKKGKVTLR
jgi:hypothetical protein